MEPTIVKVVELIERAGYRHVRNNENVAWMGRKEYRVLGPDGSILECFQNRVYHRIVASEARPGAYHYYRFLSEEYPNTPKTEFYMSDRQPDCIVDEEELYRLVTVNIY